MFLLDSILSHHIFFGREQNCGYVRDPFRFFSSFLSCNWHTFSLVLFSKKRERFSLECFYALRGKHFKLKQLKRDEGTKSYTKLKRKDAEKKIIYRNKNNNSKFIIRESIFRRTQMKVWMKRDGRRIRLNILRLNYEMCLICALFLSSKYLNGSVLLL